jgi:integrase
MSTASRPPRRRLTTVADVCREYLERAPAGKTWKTRRAEITQFIDARGDIGIEDLIADDLESFIEAHPAWKSNWTKKRVAQTIKCAFSFCWNKGLIGTHPLKGVSYQRGDRRRPMDETEFRAILRDVSAEFRRVLLFLYWTGCRPLELCTLKWRFLDVENAAFILREHKTAHSRSDGLPRMIYLPEQAVRMLTWILADQRGEREHVFLNRWGKPWSRPGLTLRIYRLRERLGIPNSAFLYGVRHSFGTRMAKAGVELKTLATLMGHTNTLQCEHYIHLAGESEHLHNALKKGLDHKRLGER